jgi:hypothetical protein
MFRYITCEAFLLELDFAAEEALSPDYAAFVRTDLYGSFESMHISFSFQFFCLPWCKMCPLSCSWFVLKKSSLMEYLLLQG